MKFAPVSMAEREVTAQIDAREGVARICSCWPERTRMLVKRYGQPKSVTTDKRGRVTSAIWEVPAKLIRFARPPSRAAIEAWRRAGSRLKDGQFAPKTPDDVGRS